MVAGARVDRHCHPMPAQGPFDLLGDEFPRPAALAKTDARHVKSCLAAFGGATNLIEALGQSTVSEARFEGLAIALLGDHAGHRNTLSKVDDVHVAELKVVCAGDGPGTKSLGSLRLRTRQARLQTHVLPRRGHCHSRHAPRSVARTLLAGRRRL